MTIFPNATISIESGIEIEVTGCIAVAGTLEFEISKEVQDGETVDVFLSKAGCIDGSFDKINVKTDANACEDVTAGQNISPNRLSIIISVKNTCENENGISGAVIGGIIGGVVAFAIVIAVIVVIFKRNRMRTAIIRAQRKAAME